MRAIPTFPHAQPPAPTSPIGGSASELAVDDAADEVVRFYWEVVRARRDHGADASELLTRPLVRDGLRALREVAPAARVRVACLVELHERTTLDGLWRAADALAASGIALDVWPHLADSDSRFLNTSTAARYQELLLPLLDRIEKERRGRDVGLCLDVEPSLSTLEGAWHLGEGTPWLDKAKGAWAVSRGVWRSVVDARQGRRDLVELARDLAARQVAVHTAVFPPIDVPGAPWWQHWLFGCPVDDDDGTPLLGTQAAMCYAPMLQKRGLHRDAQHRTLAMWAARHRQRSHAVVVGLLSTGLLGTEPVYDDVAHFRQDVASMRALGFSDLGVYSLEGLLFGSHADPHTSLRADVDDWLHALFV